MGFHQNNMSIEVNKQPSTHKLTDLIPHGYISSENILLGIMHFHYTRSSSLKNNKRGQF